MINYHCPDFWNHHYIYLELLSLYNNYKECFYENVNIGSIFGAFPGMIWNGGTFDGEKKASFKDIDYIVNFHYENKIPLNLTMTNPLIQEKHLYDDYCNMILEKCENDLNEILINSSILENYIRENFPKYKINHSILATKKDKTLNEYLEETKKYNKIVLPRRILKNWDFLNQIPFELRNKFEFLCNDPCPIDCPRLYSHYEDFGKAQLGILKNQNLIDCNFCYNTPFVYHSTQKYQISFEEIKNLYNPANFSEFKISGRLEKNYAITAIVPYLIKPEYQKDVYLILLNTSTF